MEKQQQRQRAYVEKHTDQCNDLIIILISIYHIRIILKHFIAYYRVRLPATVRPLHNTTYYQHINIINVECGWSASMLLLSSGDAWPGLACHGRGCVAASAYSGLLFSVLFFVVVCFRFCFYSGSCCSNYGRVVKLENFVKKINIMYDMNLLQMSERLPIKMSLNGYLLMAYVSIEIRI